MLKTNKMAIVKTKQVVTFSFHNTYSTIGFKVYSFIIMYRANNNQILHATHDDTTKKIKILSSGYDTTKELLLVLLQ